MSTRNRIVEVVVVFVVLSSRHITYKTCGGFERTTLIKEGMDEGISIGGDRVRVKEIHHLWFLSDLVDSSLLFPEVPRVLDL